MRYTPLAAMVLVAALAGCQSEPEQQANTAPAPQPVDVATVVRAQISDWRQFTTRLEAPEQVEVRPRVSGVIESIEFAEGGQVKAGDLLVRLDARPFQAEVDRLEAELSRARAALKQARSEARRAKQLVANKAISTEQAEAREFLAQQRQAEAGAINAALEAARLNLTFTEVRAPIDGRLSRAYITAGNTVAAGQSVVTSLMSTDRVYAYFDVDERSWNRQFAALEHRKGVAVQAQLTGEDGFVHAGLLDFVDNTVNPTTGTLRVRAVFDADSAELRPGAFARVRLSAAAPQERLMVPDRAVGTDLKSRFVLVVDDSNVLQYRAVSLGDRMGALRVITDGLLPGDRIAVNGPARVGPGMTVTPNTVVLRPVAGSEQTAATEAARQGEGDS
ncbi:efflux RND transporter periplasmic adaptor subunit [Ferrimonas sp. YFM]|uniref:efflux RND transporter periplasmic adaptor subunit n=1 Tax=Ferrimonas sp. YFM TaxID=3028878 RepID=UPI002573C803|nr:efflux RND transporter periplasmic adaptor subunit [Ferrimonas sp. YFM]BDY06036.1 resistance-nodulation-cell division multidrug efflux membrane fusion protein MexE [Ferrimonas sp. YFM]